MIEISEIRWQEGGSFVDALLTPGSAYTMASLISGLEAEVVKISVADNHAVLKVWNRESKSDVGLQYYLLRILSAQGIAVSQPLGYGLDLEGNPVLLTPYDGQPLQKLNKSILSTLVRNLIEIHRFPISELKGLSLPQYDFVRYFFPLIEKHEDIKLLLEQLVPKVNMRQNCMIHGDYNLGNILYLNGKYSIIDWTNIQLGDSRYDAAWSILLMKVYAGERNGSTYQSLFMDEGAFAADDFELFEALACLRWILLSRIAPELSKGRGILTRARSILKNNPYLPEDLLA
ncbi:aminoglycoside phosphotransferase family protein [Paenibacillus sp. 79R4]|uniref:phosphotransferase family protein n=1 Tax=Paenibacillus sp. 79R4 TaxID=2212847 RepID=UPI0015B96425|nr:aminoglycoside phosphotransferase family protein [Paenibacillus sp. 79R4]NWL86494.1 aminoglycoside phosphotransferase family protein [Paenibacillus sp. 79R4]